MSKSLFLVAGTIGVVILALLGLCGRKNSRQKLSAEDAIHAIDRAGGVEHVNREAKIIFDRFGTGKSRALLSSDLRDCPAISALGKTFTILPEDRATPARLMVVFGSHANPSELLITQTTEWRASNGFTQIASRVYFCP